MSVADEIMQKFADPEELERFENARQGVDDVVDDIILNHDREVSRRIQKAMIKSMNDEIRKLQDEGIENELDSQFFAGLSIMAALVVAYVHATAPKGAEDDELRDRLFSATCAVSQIMMRGLDFMVEEVRSCEKSTNSGGVDR
jgi:hypothetical protein